MKEKEIILKRLFSQQLSSHAFEKPEELVSWMGAVQAQDYGMSKWAIGLRIPDVSDKEVEEAMDQGKIIRTHILRPTWHWVHAADVRWMLQLTAPRILKQMAYYDRQLNIDQKEILRSARLFEKSLSGERHLTRPELEAIFTAAKFNGEGIRFGHLLMHAELRGLICSGTRKGNQNTYALLEERVPQTKKLHKEESLMRLALQYLQSHGPATLKDFTWWSGLTATDAKKAMMLLGEQSGNMLTEGEYFYGTHQEEKPKTKSPIILLPNYDEYTVAYSNREAIIGEGYKEKIARQGNPLFYNVILYGGKICGTWKREVKAKGIIVVKDMFEELSAAKQRELQKAEERFKKFVTGS